MPRRWSMIGLLPVNLQPCSTSICCTIQLWGTPYFSHSCRCFKKICRMGRRDMNHFLFLLLHGFIVFNSIQVECNFVDITYVQNAVTEGAVCLDGSPPAYHLSPGFGIGVDNWLVQFEGGGWCNNVTKCLARKETRLGSSRAMLKKIAFSGILSNNPQHNPDFYNWNKVKVRYCDGSSFTGDVEEVDPVTKLYYRGARVFLAVIDDLKANGMSQAANALISGCSAGGLTSIIHCDHFRSLLPENTNVKCLSDAGYFINEKDVSGMQRMQSFYNDLLYTHQSKKNLPSSCTSKMSPELCFFPENMVQEIKTPLFILNAAYDSWQIKNSLAPGVADPNGTWHECKTDIRLCSSSQIRSIQGFRLDFLIALSKIGRAASGGLFINSCYAHCQSETQETWFAEDSPVLGQTTIAEAVGEWYYGRNQFQTIDCPYPCDSTCHNRVFEDDY